MTDHLDGFSGTAARVVDADGRPLAGVELTLHTPGFRGDSGAAQELLLDSDKVLRSDSLGYALFNLARPGRYVVEGSRDGTVLFFDTLAVSDVKALSIYTFRTRPAMPVKGGVRLESGLRLVSGTVFVRGTARFARLDSAGSFDLGLPCPWTWAAWPSASATAPASAKPASPSRGPIPPRQAGVSIPQTGIHLP